MTRPPRRDKGMTRPPRYDQGTRRGSVIRGLRCEPDLAKRLSAAAVERAEGNVAMMARYLIHTQLGWSHEDAIQLEEKHAKPSRLCGLALPAVVYQRLVAQGTDLGLTVTGTARHLLRLGLGVPASESREREEKFSSLAQALREVREAYK